MNSRAATVGPVERQLMERVKTVVQQTIPRSQVRWAGSQRKGTAVVGSDLDMCVESTEPVTEAVRRALRGGLEGALGRRVTVHSHVVRIAAAEDVPKIDIAFAHAAFGNRPLPDPAAFENRAGRQTAARALKLWTRHGNLPYVAGWALEALVVHLDQPGGRPGLELFQRVTGWLESTATQLSIEGVLRAANFGRWNEAWSAGVPGRLTALRNHARALRSRSPAPEAWRSSEDVGRWLCP